MRTQRLTRMGGALFGAAAFGLAACGLAALGLAAAEAPDEGAARADGILARMAAGPAANAEAEGQLQRDAFASFLERLEDAFDGDRALRLAEGMHARADAVWSAFCLEGALRRASGAREDRPDALRSYRRADAVLVQLLARGDLSRADRLALVHRRAILAAGFGDRAAEREALGLALALGGIDGAQISGLAALTRGDAGAAARLFGSLLDGGHPPEALPWPVRGHGLATLESLRVVRAR